MFLTFIQGCWLPSSRVNEITDLGLNMLLMLVTFGMKDKYVSPTPTALHLASRQILTSVAVEAHLFHLSDLAEVMPLEVNCRIKKKKKNIKKLYHPFIWADLSQRGNIKLLSVIVTDYFCKYFICLLSQISTSTPIPPGNQCYSSTALLIRFIRSWLSVLTSRQIAPKH